MSAESRKWPSWGAMPNEIETGDSTLDAYLRELDQFCLGSPKVRQLYLEEIRDNLLAARDQAAAEGQSPNQAANTVVADFGPAETLALVQRNRRWQDFRRAGLGIGLGFGSLMLVFQVLAGHWHELGTLGLAFLFLFQGSFFGLLMGFWFAFSFAPATSAPNEGPEESGDAFEVYSPPLSRYLAILMMVVMGVMAVMPIAGVLGFGFLTGLAPAAALFISLMAIHVAVSMRVGLVRIGFAEGKLSYRNLMNSEGIPLSSVTAFEPLSIFERVLYPLAGQAYRLTWKDGDNERTLRIGLNREMVNADRLRALLFSSNPSSPGL